MFVSQCRWSKRAAAVSLPSVRFSREELLAFYMSFVAVFPRRVDLTNATRIESCLQHETYLCLCASACNLFLLLSVGDFVICVSFLVLTRQHCFESDVSLIVNCTAWLNDSHLQSVQDAAV